MFVSDYMTPNPVLVKCGEPVSRLAETMSRLRIHQVPVVDESNRLIGIVSDRDVRSAIGYGERNSNLNLVAEDVMSHDVVTVTPGTELSRAVEIFSEKRFGGLPVMENGAVVGIIARHDLIRRLDDLMKDVSMPELTAPW